MKRWLPEFGPGAFRFAVAGLACANAILAVSVDGTLRRGLAAGVALLCVAAAVLLHRGVPRPRVRLRRPVSDDRDGFTEDLDLTVWVGARPEDDRVLEKRSTFSARSLRRRALTLISAYAGSDTQNPPVTPEIAVKGPTVASWEPSGSTGRGVVSFVPPPRPGELRWSLSYTIPHGLWNPLRASGVDVFRYDLRDIRIRRLTVRFVFHSGARAVTVQERNRRGTQSAELSADRVRTVVWISAEPATEARYEWDIRVAWRSTD
ncbi:MULTISPECIES: hypothetical protein [Actinoplanes]|uniref:hypothetical protein n=1 Tax=Actinoplanes TaxID=1865 RepID=UPI0005F27FED|nr:MULTISPECIES: hypothetical protein [Actinoplanes]GLY02909.1 hypothetical protein Acsp01_32880 [Actinoplanes sp. NBRC 101535]